MPLCQSLVHTLRRVLMVNQYKNDGKGQARSAPPVIPAHQIHECSQGGDQAVLQMRQLRAG